MRFAEFAVPAVVLALLGGPAGVLYLLCAGVVKLGRRTPRPRVSRPS
jgi:hypothetical protein